MSDILEQIIAKKYEEVALMKREMPLAQIKETLKAQPPALEFTGALRASRPRGSGSEVNVIAEIKQRSPSKGVFAWHGDASRQGRDYQKGGAKAISVVTDGPFFGGSIDMLKRVKNAVEIPVMQKEFVVDPYQVYLARAIGADAVLLIAAVLEGSLLGELTHLAKEVGISTLVEIVDEDELHRATEAGAEVVGVNNRDLRTFTTDAEKTLRLLPGFSENQVAITESGIHNREHVEKLLAGGVDGFLIGEALMLAPDPVQHLMTLRGGLAEEAAR